MAIGWQVYLEVQNIKIYVMYYCSVQRLNTGLNLIHKDRVSVNVDVKYNPLKNVKLSPCSINFEQRYKEV
jgi:hypothetical protein